MRQVLRLAVFASLAACAYSQVSASVGIEPTLAPQAGRFSLETDCAASFAMRPDTAVIAQFGYSDSIRPTREWLGGFSRNLVEVSTGWTLYVAGQAGAILDRFGPHGIAVAGVGLSQDLANGWSASYALDLNKQHGQKMWPSLVVSLSKTFDWRKR